MDVYSPSHPTDQDGECEAPSFNFNDITGNESIENTHDSDRVAADTEVFANDKDYCQLKSPDLSPTLSSNSENPDYILNVREKHFCESFDTPSNILQSDENRDENGSSAPKEKGPNEIENFTKNEKTVKLDVDRDKRSPTRGKKSENERPRKDHSPSKKGCSSHHPVPRSRHRSRSPRRKRSSRSPERSSRRRSSSRSRYRRRSRSRRYSRSKSRESRRKHSRSTSRSRFDRRQRDSRRRDRGSRSRSHQRDRHHGDNNESIGNDRQGSFISTMTELTVPPSQSSNPQLQEMDSRNNPSSECQYDMDETSTPDISEDQNPGIGTVNENAVFVFQQGQAPPPVPTNLINWSNQVEHRPPQFNQDHLQSIPTIQNAFQQRHHTAPPRFNNYQQQFRSIAPPPPDFAPPSSCPNLMSQRPPTAFNLSAARIPRFPPSDQLMGFNGMLNPLLNPFAFLTTQPPPPPPPPFNPGSAPPVPQEQFAKQLGGGNTILVPFQPPPLEMPHRNSPPPPPPPSSEHNLLETLMTKAGLSADGLHSNNPSFSMAAIPLPESAPPPPTLENKSPMKKISKLLNSAASSLLNATRGTNATGSSPPPPPPPLPISGLPPLPPISEVSNGNGNVPSTSDGRNHHHKHRSEHTQLMLSKKRRSEFGSSREWQERIAMEVKGFIKPYYVSGKVSKEDCRTVLKRSVNKIFKSKCTLIETRKIGEFVKLYLKKYQKYRKWQARQQQAMQLELQAANKKPAVQ